MTAISGAVLVTGARGRLGRLLVEDLRSRGVKTIAVGRQPTQIPHLDDVVVDLRDADAAAAVVARAQPETIVHLAAVLRGDDLLTQNALLDRAVTDAARSAGTPSVVFASSAAVYGTDDRGPRREESPLRGGSDYARSKIAGEDAFRTLADCSPGSVTTLRIFNVAGPAFPDSLVQRLLHATAQAPVSVIEPEHFVRDYIHQCDLMAVLRACVAGSAEGYRVLNVGAGVAVSTEMLLDRLCVHESCVVRTAGAPSTSWAEISTMVDECGVKPRAIPDLSWSSARLAG